MSVIVSLTKIVLILQIISLQIGEIFGFQTGESSIHKQKIITGEEQEQENTTQQYLNAYSALPEKDQKKYISTQREYFQKALDKDADGKISIKEWYEEIMTLDYEEGLTLKDVEQTFNMFDKDQDGVIIYKEFLEASSPHLLKYENPEYQKEHSKHPKEIHLSFTNDDKIMQVMWVIPRNQECVNPIVQYGKDKDNLDMTVKGSYHTYNVGIGGFSGLIYVAYMENLDNNAQYYYRVGDFKQQIFSDVIPFKTSPKKGESLEKVDIVMYGDQGTKVPASGPVNDMVIKDNEENHFNFVFLVGDLSYAGQGSEKKGSIQAIWDMYGEQNEPWAKSIPFMPGVGNHEKYYNYTAYKQRFELPRSQGSGENFWFSFDYGYIHFLHMSTEHPYEEGTPQYEFLESDLKKASLNPNTKWIVFGGHRPILSSMGREYDQHKPGAPLISAIQPLLNKYKVDFVMTGHEHCYERIHPNVNGKVEMTGNVYNNPKYPVYIVQGTAGAIIRSAWIEDQPDWSAFRESKYGYGRFRAYNNGTLHYQHVRLHGGVGDEFWLNKEM